ncbi:hypothetical protein, partial [Mycobacterium avium]|uniref:hypothetical protein n=1 Tax=Mycobacterium avium TaxID=1764 RepID=UPI00190E684C
NYAPSWGTSSLEDTFGMLRAEYDLNDNWTAYIAGGAKHTNEIGRYSSVTLNDTLGNATVTSSRIAHQEDNTSLMAGLNGKFQTGAVSHKLNFGLTGIWAQTRNAYDFDLTGHASNIYNPVDVAGPAK